MGDLPSLLKVERRRAGALKGEVSHTSPVPFSDLMRSQRINMGGLCTAVYNIRCYEN